MKNILIVACVVLSSFVPAFAQDYMTTIAEKSCACLDKIEISPESEEFNMRLGLCMLEAATPYKKEIERDHNIKLDNIDTEGEKLGRIIGMKMAIVCPNTLVKLTQKSNETGQSAASDSEELSSEGTITKIENDLFVAFSIKDASGKVNKFFWFFFIESEVDMVNSYQTLMGKKVSISYVSQEFFDPRIKEYRQFFVLTKLQTLN